MTNLIKLAIPEFILFSTMRKIFIFIFLIFFSLFSFGQKTNITLEEIWKNYAFYAKQIGGFNSMKDGEHYTTLETKDEKQLIVKYLFKNGKKTRIVFDSSEFEIPRISFYKFSNDERKILLATETERIYRYSKKAIYYVYNVHTDKLKKLKDEKIMYASFSPDGDKIAYVFENNLYIMDLIKESVQQITTDGDKNSIINGASDWVYEEEFGLVKAFEWSPDGKTIAYYRFDESKVKQFSMDIFKKSLYPTQEVFKYPKAGEKNSVIRLYLYNLENKKHINIYTEKDYEYFPRIKWTLDPSKIAVLGMNRLQNELDFILVNANDGSNKILFTEKDKYYIDIHDNLTFLPNEYFIWTSEKDGYNHIYLKGIDGSEEQITNGNWEVTSFHGLDSDKMDVFFSSTEDGSINRSLYSLNLNTKKKKKLSTNIGTNTSSFSKGMKYYLNVYSTAKKPPIYTLHKANGQQIKVLESNSLFIQKLSNYNISEKEFFTISTDETEMNAWMIKPPDFDADKKYPLYMYVYGGPGSQQVKNSWGWQNYFWHQHLAQQGYIIACVDNRGTGGKGAEFKKMTYKQLGKYETIDQINAAKYFGNLPYIDEKRIGIQGWSYGGYMSSLAITKGADIFKLAIAVAPVTNWRYYDNIYTERFMRTPEENSNGYDDNSPINYVERLKGKYLLIHGTADDNVHIQNTYEMVSALVKANKQFELFIYPDKRHGISGGNTSYHLYKKMTDFILDNL